MNKRLPNLITLRITARNGDVARVVVSQEQFAKAYGAALIRAAKVEALISEVYI